MRDLYLKRNELKEKSKYLSTAKFDGNISQDKVDELIEVQKEIYKRYKFYDEFLKIGGKIYGEHVHTQKR